MNGRVAAVDIGSNSIKILVARHGPAVGTLEALYERTSETRISTGIAGQPPRMSDAAMQAGVQAVLGLLKAARPYGYGEVAMVATSAVRTATNGAAFLEQLHAATGVAPRLLSGEEEAETIAAGIRTDPAVGKWVHDATIFDLGGGSLELIRMVGGHLHQRISLPLGAVRLTEMFVRNPFAPLPDAVQLDIVDHVRIQLQQSGFVFSRDLIGSSGGLAIIRQRLAQNSGNPAAASSHLISRDYLENLCTRVCRQTMDERIHLSRLPEARADIFPAALLVFQSIFALSGADHLHHSYHNLRYGIAARLLGIA